MKANYEEDKVIVSATEPTGVNRKKVWFKKGKNLSNINSFNSVNTLQNTFIIKSKVVANSYIVISLTKSRISDTTITNNIIYGISKIHLYNKSNVLLNTIVGKTFSNFTSGSINVEEKITIPADCDYIVVDCSNNNGDNNYNTSVTDIMIEQNTVKTAYEAYIEPEIYILNSNNVYEKFENTENDTKWQNATITGKFATYNSNTVNTPKYRRIGRVVEIRGIVTPTENIAGSSEIKIIFTLPTEFRPNSDIVSLCQGSGTNSWLCTIFSNGNVCFSRHRTGANYSECATGYWLPFQVMFFIE